MTMMMKVTLNQSDDDDDAYYDDDAYDDVLHLGFYSAPTHLGPPNIFWPWPT